MNSFFTVDYTIQRLQQTGNKSDYIATSLSGSGHLKQEDNEFAQLNVDQLGETWKLTVEGDADIVVTDKVIIDGEDYRVSGVKKNIFGSINFKEITLVKKLS